MPERVFKAKEMKRVQIKNKVINLTIKFKIHSKLIWDIKLVKVLKTESNYEKP